MRTFRNARTERISEAPSALAQRFILVFVYMEKYMKKFQDRRTRSYQI